MTWMLLLASLVAVRAEPLRPGQHTRTLTVDGRERNYIFHIPKRKERDGISPVVLVFHGGGSNAEQMVRFSGLSDKAEEAGFVAVYPSGTGRLQRVLTFNGGNCCGYADRQNVDDVKFTAKLLDDLASVVPIDEKRVFATGMSNGAIMCYLLASKLSDRIAAIAPVAGPMGTESCSPIRAVPVCHFQGTNDEFASYHGGPGKKSRTQTEFFSVKHSIDTWVRANGCEERPKIDELPTIVDDGTTITRTLYRGGKERAEVVLYTINGGGHTWPGQPPRLRFLGKSTKNLSANDVMWRFFQRHGR